MTQHRGLLIPEERARITELQDALIQRYVERNEAFADGREARAKELQDEIDDLLREKKEVAGSIPVGSTSLFKRLR